MPTEHDSWEEGAYAKLAKMNRLLVLLMFTAVLLNGAELNHFFIILDHQTYAAIAGNGFLKSEFAAFEQRTTVRTDKTYTGIYFYGTHTYFEFMEADGDKRTPGDSGIAFGVDSVSAEPKPTSSDRPLTTRQWQGVQLPWFYTLTKVNQPDLVVWLMEYHPDFLAKWHPEAGGSLAGISRDTVLRRYKAVLAQQPADPLLEDVAGLTVATSQQERQTFEQWIRGIGSEFPIKFVEPAAGRQGIQEVRFKLRRAPTEIVKISLSERSVLQIFPDGTARWTF